MIDSKGLRRLKTDMALLKAESVLLHTEIRKSYDQKLLLESMTRKLFCDLVCSEIQYVVDRHSTAKATDWAREYTITYIRRMKHDSREPRLSDMMSSALLMCAKHMHDLFYAYLDDDYRRAVKIIGLNPKSGK